MGNNLKVLFCGMHANPEDKGDKPYLKPANKTPGPTQCLNQPSHSGFHQVTHSPIKKDSLCETSHVHHAQHPKTREHLGETVHHKLEVPRRKLLSITAGIDEEPEPYLIVAIDVGTTNCGYAFGSANENRISVNTNWAEKYGFTSFKTPTAFMSNNDKEYIGFDAFETYLRLQDNEEDVQPFYQNLHKHPNKRHDTGDLHFLGKIAGFLFRKYCEKTQGRHNKSTKTNLKVIFAVGDDWKADQCNILNEQIEEHAKNIPIECVTTHIKSSHAAFFGCLHPLQRVNIGQPKNVLIISTGGSVCTFSLYACSGNDTWAAVRNKTCIGSASINIRFVDELITTLSSAFVEEMWYKLPSIWFSFMNSFEKVKYGAKPQISTGYTLPLEYAFADTFSQVHAGTKLKSFLESKDTGFSVTKGSTFAISSEQMNTLFAEVVKEVKETAQIFTTDDETKPEVVFLSGGMANCLYLKNVITAIFSSCPLIIPEDANMCTAKGSVLYGKTETYSEVTISTCDIYIDKRMQISSKDAEDPQPFPAVRLDTLDQQSAEQYEKICSKGNDINKAEKSFILSMEPEQSEEDYKAYNIAIYVSNNNDKGELLPVEMVGISASMTRSIHNAMQHYKTKGTCYFEREQHELYIKIKFGIPDEDTVKCLLPKDCVNLATLFHM